MGEVCVPGGQDVEVPTTAGAQENHRSHSTSSSRSSAHRPWVLRPLPAFARARCGRSAAEAAVPLPSTVGRAMPADCAATCAWQASWADFSNTRSKDCIGAPHGFNISWGAGRAFSHRASAGPLRASRMSRSAFSVAANSSGAESCDTWTRRLRRPVAYRRANARCADAISDRTPRSRCRRPCGILRRHDAWYTNIFPRERCTCANLDATLGRHVPFSCALTSDHGARMTGLGFVRSTSCTWPRNDMYA